jgi:transposase-like protein
MDECPNCGASEVIHLGGLANLVWFRCRSCGNDFAKTDSDAPTFEPQPNEV